MEVNTLNKRNKKKRQNCRLGANFEFNRLLFKMKLAAVLTFLCNNFQESLFRLRV